MDTSFDNNPVSENKADTAQDKILTEESYWEIPTDQFSSFIQLAMQFGWKSGRDIVSKSVSLSLARDQASIICRATDFDSYLEVKIPFKSSNPIQETLIFPTSTLLKVLPLSPKTLVLKKDSILILDQWVSLESVVLEPSIFTNLDPVSVKGDIELPNLSAIIPIASSATVPRDRNIRFYEDCIQSTCLWSEARLPFKSPIEFSLTSRETNLLKSLGKTINISLTNSDLPRIRFRSNNITLWMMYRKPEAPLEDLNMPKWYIDCEYESISKLVSMSETFPSSTGLLQFSYSDQFIVTYNSKLANTSFPIFTMPTGSPDKLSLSQLQTKQIKQYLKALSTETISLAWSSTSLYLFNDNITVSLRWEV